MGATLTRDSIRSWSLSNFKTGTVGESASDDWGALEKGAVTLHVEGNVKEIEAANFRSVVKRMISGWKARIEFGALEFTRERLAAIMQNTDPGDAGSIEIGTKTELLQFSCEATLELSDGSSGTVTGDIEFDPNLELGFDVSEEASPAVTANFVPDATTSNLLATIVLTAA